MALRAQGDDYEHTALHSEDGQRFLGKPAVATGQWVGPRSWAEGASATDFAKAEARPANPAGPPAYEAAGARASTDLSAGWRDVRAFPPPTDTHLIACWADGKRAGARLETGGGATYWVSGGHACPEPFFWMEIPAPPPALMVKMRAIADLQRQIDDIRRT